VYINEDLSLFKTLILVSFLFCGFCLYIFCTATGRE